MTFQPGDVLGYYRPDSQLSIYFEVVALNEGQLEHLYSSESAASQLNISGISSRAALNTFINVVTGK